MSGDLLEDALLGSDIDYIKQYIEVHGTDEIEHKITNTISYKINPNHQLIDYLVQFDNLRVALTIVMIMQPNITNWSIYYHLII